MANFRVCYCMIILLLILAEWRAWYAVTIPTIGLLITIYIHFVRKAAAKAVHKQRNTIVYKINVEPGSTLHIHQNENQDNTED